MGDVVNKAVKEYEIIVTDGTGKLGRSQLPTFSCWSDKDSAAVRCICTVCSGLVEILSVASIGKIITTPFLKLIGSKTVATHILDLNQHFLQLQIDLKQWSKDPSDLISGETVLFPEVPLCKDDIFDAVFSNYMLPDTDVISESASLMSTHLYLIVSRLLINQLPEGCHSTNSETIRKESLTVPKHNRTSEKILADFKQISHFKPNAPIEHIEATLMWVNNKTVEWLDLMDPEIKNAKITLAMKRAHEFISKWHERKIN
ncbi:unnamed protein product [Mytilus coruscus]|uniref:Uncharacterized protein n=1 Tax=Mytilus coruscus TaxID=42192 RepID=A0A6J8CKT6_MYTCO|nr:unnamed protein product [Mytilus coruscus]